MEDWDQDKLEDVVKQKHGAEKPSNKTDIICKFFLDAVENKLYGWSVSLLDPVLTDPNSQTVANWHRTHV